MRRPLSVLVTVFALAGPGALAEPKPVRTGWNSMMGQPYGCMYLEVTGPSAAKALIMKRAKEQYRDPDQAAIEAVADRVVVRASAISERRCAGRVPRELIFVSKKTDRPALRLPVMADTVTLQNGFGATWTTGDGVAVVQAAEFKAALGDGGFKVLVVLESGATEEIKSGIGQSTWSGDHTRKALE